MLSTSRPAHGFMIFPRRGRAATDLQRKLRGVSEGMSDRLGWERRGGTIFFGWALGVIDNHGKVCPFLHQRNLRRTAMSLDGSASRQRKLESCRTGKQRIDILSHH